MSITNLSSEQLRKAAGLKDKIVGLQNELSRILGSTAQTPAASKGKRTMSASARAKIAAAQKARWAKHNSSAKPAAAAPVKKARRKMSAAARARIAAAAKARWEKARAAGKKTL